MSASISRPHKEDPGYLTERVVSRRFAETKEYVTLYEGNAARNGGLFPESTGIGLLAKYPEGWVLDFESVAIARKALNDIAAKRAKFDDFFTNQTARTGIIEAREGVLQLVVDTREAAMALDGAIALRIPWEDLAKVLKEGLTATKFVPVGGGEYMEVPDHAERRAAVKEIRETVIGRAVTRQVIVHHDERSEAEEMEKRSSDPRVLEAMKMFLEWAGRKGGGATK